MGISRQSIKKILVLRYRTITNIIMTGPVLEALSLTYPDARVDMVVDDVLADICYEHPFINHLLLNKRDRGSMGKAEYFMHNLRFIRKIRKNRYDLVIDLHCDRKSSWLSLLSGAKYRLGQRSRFKNRFAYNMAALAGAKGLHASDMLLQSLLPLEISIPEE